VIPLRELVAAAFFVIAVPATARAGVDLTGRWGVRALGFGSPVGCLVEVTQRDSNLQVVGSCTVAGALQLSGNIDPATGTFAVSGHSEVCTTLTAAGSAAADGQSFSGTVSCMVGPLALQGTFRASHCGNGILDPGEDCDDGNVFDGDCCSSVCRFEASSSPCPDGGNGCTDDLCDGHGHCQHLPDPGLAGAACGPFDLCATGHCDATGVCVREPRPDGFPCDAGDPCTSGACLQGQCVGGPPMCGACRSRERTPGCLPSEGPGCPRPQPERRAFAAACLAGRLARHFGGQLWDGIVGSRSATCCIAFSTEDTPPPDRPAFLNLQGRCVIPHFHGRRWVQGADENGAVRTLLCRRRNLVTGRGCCDLTSTALSTTDPNGLTPTPTALTGAFVCPHHSGTFTLSRTPRTP
jgi:cysteine-rich repeat protein